VDRDGAAGRCRRPARRQPLRGDRRRLRPGGNPAVEASHTLAVDETAPTGGTPDLIAGSDSGTSNTDNITDITNPTFSVALNGTVAAGDIVELLLGGASLAHPVTHTISTADITAGSVNLTVTHPRAVPSPAPYSQRLKISPSAGNHPDFRCGSQCDPCQDGRACR
jgi:hypothetical protein